LVGEVSSKRNTKGTGMSDRHFSPENLAGHVMAQPSRLPEVQLTEHLAKRVLSMSISEALHVIGTLTPCRKCDVLLSSLGLAWGRQDINQAWSAVSASSLQPAIKQRLLSAMWG
jgi:hypothetical protein